MAAIVTLAIAVSAASPASANVLATVPGASLLTGVACASAQTCVAVGQAGAQQQGVVVPAADPATNSAVGSVEPVANTNELYSVACATTSSCIAVGTGYVASEGVIVPVTNGVAGGAIAVSGTAYLHGVACYTSTVCVAVGWQTGNFGGNSYVGVVVPLVGNTPGAVEQISGSLFLNAVSCGANGSCVAVGSNTSGHGIVVPITNGTSGGAEPAGESELEGVGCEAATSCVAVGGDTVVPIADGAPGSTEPQSGASTLWGAGCATTTTCWVAGSDANAPPDGGVARIDNGSPPEATLPVSGTSRFYGIACVEQSSCVAVGQAPPLGSGAAVIYAFGAVEDIWKMRDQATATQDLPNALKYATIVCTPEALGVAGFSLGALFSGTAGALAVPGLLATYGFGPVCLKSILRVIDDQHRVKDPPDRNINRLATPAAVAAVKMPSCKRFTGSARGFCNQLSAAEKKWVRDAESVVAIGAALATSSAREASAVAAGDQSTVDLQDAQIETLESQQSAAQSAESAAGKAVARVLKAHHIGIRMNKAQSAKTIRAIEQLLAKQGLSTATLQQLGFAIPKPGSVNILAALAKG